MAPQDKRSDERTTPSPRENWIAMLVLGIAIAFLGIISPQVSSVVEIPPLLTILTIAAGATLVVVSGVTLFRLSHGDGAHRCDDPVNPPDAR